MRKRKHSELDASGLKKKRKLKQQTGDTGGMKNNPINIATWLIICVLIATVAVFRLGEIGVFTGEKPSVSAGRRFCVGVEHPDIRLGIVCASGHDRVIAAAIKHLGLPERCNTVELPSTIKNGDQVALSDEGGCSFVRSTRLPGALRLLCGARINANSDDSADLALLPGIGETKARRIVESREKDGPFSDIDDLTRVHGIGPKTAARLQNWLEW